MSAGSTPTTTSTRRSTSQGPQCQEPGRRGQDQPLPHRHLGLRLHHRLPPRPRQGHEVRELGGPVEARDEGQALRARLRPEPYHHRRGHALGRRCGIWEKGQDKLKALKPSFKAFYTNDANSQQLLANGEAPVQVVLSMNATTWPPRACRSRWRSPRKARSSASTRGDHEGHEEGRAGLQVHQHRCSIPRCRPRSPSLKKGSPVVINAKLDPEVAKLPGVFTTADQWKHPGHHHRPQAARRENRRMAQVVHREHHQLTLPT